MIHVVTVNSKSVLSKAIKILDHLSFEFDIPYESSYYKGKVEFIFTAKSEEDMENLKAAMEGYGVFNL